MSLLLFNRTPANGSGGVPGPGGHSWFFAPRISYILGSPLANVEANWPLLYPRVPSETPNPQIAALATIGVEASGFWPINEFGGQVQYGGQWYDYFFYMYDKDSPDPDRRAVARDLGNTHQGDGIRFHGRGLIQLTGRGNYQYYGDKLGYDLVGDPNLANDPEVACAVFALFCDERGVWAAAERQDWRAVRRLVNGGYNGLQPFLGFVGALQQAAYEA